MKVSRKLAKIRVASVAALAVATIVIGSMPAFGAGVALDDVDEANSVADAISEAADFEEPTLEPVETSEAIEAEAVGIDALVSLPVEAGTIYLGESDAADSVAVIMPPEADVESAVIADDGTVVYAATDTSGDSGVDIGVTIIEDGSIRIHTVISSPDAPHEFTYELEVPEGTTLSIEDDGSVSGLDPEGRFVVGAATPWATDANGVDVETSYRLEGNAIIQTVETSDENAYPVVADPWLGVDLISSVVWATNLWQYSPTMKVYPTWYGRFGPAAARWAAWSETLAKTPRRGWPYPDTATLRDQFYCHWDIVRLRAPNKEYWGLDSKLPNRGYWGFVANECN